MVWSASTGPFLCSFSIFHPSRRVRTLCHHIATEPGHLSFNKGDVMQVLSKADPDWLLCSLGSTQGLVPIIYVTLSGTEDGQRPGQY